MKRITVAIVVCITMALTMLQVLNGAEQKGFTGNVRAELQISRQALCIGSTDKQVTFNINVFDPDNKGTIQNGTAVLIRGKGLYVNNGILYSDEGVDYLSLIHI